MGFFDDLEEAIEDIVDGIADFIDDVMKEARTLYREVLDWLSSRLRLLVEKITAFVSKFIARVQQKGLVSGIALITAHVVRFFSTDKLGKEARKQFNVKLHELSDSQFGKLVRRGLTGAMAATHQESLSLTAAERREIGDGYITHTLNQG